MTTSVIGKPLTRVDGRAKVTGGARYAADFNQPGQVYAVIVSATVGLGRVTGIDAAAVSTHARRHRRRSVISMRRAWPTARTRAASIPPSASGCTCCRTIRCASTASPSRSSSPTTLDHAERAAAALRITYAAEPPVVDPSDPKAQAIVPEAAGMRTPTRRAATPTALWRARPVKVDATYDIARENHNPMEPHATVAAWNGDRLTLWSKSQYRRERAGRDRGHLRHSRRERAGHLPLHRRRLRHEPQDLAACHAGGHRGAAGRTPGQARAHPQADVLHDRPSPAHHAARRPRRDAGRQADEPDP